MQIAASPGAGAAIRALADLLLRLRLDHVFVGSVARAAWLGERVEAGPIDVVATMGPQSKNQLAMMASNRGFRVERAEIEASEELDLVPLWFEETRLHVLVASNALYGRMVADGVPVTFEELTLRVPRIEDFALLVQMSSDVQSLMQLIDAPGFDRTAYNRKLASIGLRTLVIPE